VNDGHLSITLETVLRNAIISGIEIIDESQLITHLESENSFNEVSVYPNPSNGVFTIEMSSEMKSHNEVPYAIYDLTGKVIEQSSISGSRKNIDLSGEKKGVYIMTIGDFGREKIFIY
jgi:hypothetical protein